MLSLFFRGLWDQRVAMRWAQDNIHLFGGDKNKVTSAQAEFSYLNVADRAITNSLGRKCWRQQCRIPHGRQRHFNRRSL